MTPGNSQSRGRKEERPLFTLVEVQPVISIEAVPRGTKRVDGTINPFPRKTLREQISNQRWVTNISRLRGR